MRRALDTARLQLRSLGERDPILDCYFEHARGLFQFSVLFLLRGDSAHGRNVHGLGAPDGLVTRLAFPLSQPGILSRARDLRRPFVVTGQVTEGDATLFGSLGRAMPSALVVPLMVRDRVVAVFVGDGPVEALQKRAYEAGRGAVELAKEEMLLWSESVGEALEKLILRRRSQSSAPPPPGAAEALAFGSIPPAKVPRFDEPVASPAPVPDVGHEPRPAPEVEPLPAAAWPEASTAEPVAPAQIAQVDERARRRRSAFFVAGVLGAVALAAGLWGLRTPSRQQGDPVVVAGDAIPGWPSAVDPGAVVDAAKRASGLGDGAALSSIRADVVHGGHVDFSSPPANDEAFALRLAFVTDDREAEVHVDRHGVHRAHPQPRAACGKVGPCRRAAPLPTCSFSQIWGSSVAAGLTDADHAVVTYADGAELGGEAGPLWRVAVAGRGHIRIDPATCKALAGDRLIPPPLPVAKVPGAPAGVSPVEALALARAQSGLPEGAVLLEIDARGVGSDGRVDLAAEGARVEYTFAEPASVPAPVRRWRVVELSKGGMKVTSGASDEDPLPRRFLGVAAPPPLCSFAHVFKTAGALPAGTRAHVLYGISLGSEAAGWTIEVPGAGLRKTIDDDVCAEWEALDAK